MPKKRKTKEERERIIEKPVLSQEEANSLEQRLEKDEEKIDFSELREFLDEPRKKKSSPSLEKVNTPQEVPTGLEGNLNESQTSNNNSNGEDNPFKYASGNAGKQGGEAKYAHYGGMIEEMTPRTEIPNMGKGRPLERREVRFESSAQSRIGMQESFEKYVPVKKVDKDNLGKENPFQKKEIKYAPERY